MGYTDLGRWLFRETHGHPFYVIETLKVLAERQVLTWHRSSEGEKLEVDVAALEEASARPGGGHD
jgi:predicted ATPase